MAAQLLNNNKPFHLLSNLISHVAENRHELAYITTASGQLVYANRMARLHFELENETTKETEQADTNVFQLNPELTPATWNKATTTALVKGEWTLRVNPDSDPSAALEINLIPHTFDADETCFVCTNLHRGTVNWSEQLLGLLAEATSPQTGETFFKTLMRNMATAFQVKHAFITECLDEPPTRVRMLAFWSDQQFVDALEYDLKGSPCDDTINCATLILHKKDLGELFPVEKGFAESYLGVPVFNADQSKVIGHIAFLDDQPMQDQGLTRAAFEIFTSRASAELQRVRAERELRSSEHHYRLLVENQTDLILKLDEQQGIQFASPSFYHCFNIRQGKTTGNKPFIEYFPAEHHDDLSQCLQKVVKDNEPADMELQVYTRQGRQWFNWSFKTMQVEPGEDSGTGQIIAVGRDITKRREAEERDQKHIQQLAHIGRVHSMGEIAAGLAHELNQPLTVIMSFANAMQRVLRAKDELDPEVAEALERIVANTDRAGKIIRRMRDFVKKGDSHKVDTPINTTIREVLQLMKIELRNAQVQVHQQLQNNLPTIKADPVQIQQVLANLIRNAIEALVTNAYTQRQIFITSKLTSDNQIEVSIEDNGSGLSPQIEAQLFEAFVTSKPEGLGIGLSICQSIIQAHNGEIRGFNQLQSQNLTTGTLFIFTLPITQQEELS